MEPPADMPDDAGSDNAGSDDAAFEKRRLWMVAQQIRRRDVTDEGVLHVMERVPRHRFIPPDLHAQAYEDNALAIGRGQTISQPYIVAIMTAALELTGTQRVLEIGTGSGYQAAILSQLAESVVSIERHGMLARQARKALAALGYHNVTVVVDDGARGFALGAPFDRIIVTAAAAHVPSSLFEQLAEGGILVIPIGDTTGQTLKVVRKVDGRAEETSLGKCRFVPFVGAQEDTE